MVNRAEQNTNWNPDTQTHRYRYKHIKPAYTNAHKHIHTSMDTKERKYSTQ